MLPRQDSSTANAGFFIFILFHSGPFVSKTAPLVGLFFAVRVTA
jgi:hypothetical protein